MLESAQQEPAETLGETGVRSGLKLGPFGRGAPGGAGLRVRLCDAFTGFQKQLLTQSESDVNWNHVIR